MLSFVGRKILDKKKIKEWSENYDKLFRINQRTWWKQEEATEEEMEYGRKKLKEHGNRVELHHFSLRPTGCYQCLFRWLLQARAYDTIF